MQFMIDVANDPTIQLRAIAQLILEACATRDAAGAVTLTGPAPGAPIEAVHQPTPAEVFGNRETLPAAFCPPPPPPPPPIVARAISDAAEIIGYAPPPPAVVENPAVLAATQAAAIEASGAEVDVKGVAYDPNIHSSSRARMKNGEWKKRRGGPITGTAPPPPPPPAADPPRLPSSASVAGNDAVGATVAAAAPPPPPPPATVVVVPLFRTVMKKITDAVAAGKLSHERVDAIVKGVGVPDLTTLNAMPGKVPEVDALIDAELFGK